MAEWRAALDYRSIDESAPETARQANKRNLIYQTVEFDSAAAADAVMMRPHPPLGGSLGIEMHEIAKC